MKDECLCRTDSQKRWYSASSAKYVTPQQRWEMISTHTWICWCVSDMMIKLKCGWIVQCDKKLLCSREWTHDFFMTSWTNFYIECFDTFQLLVFLFSTIFKTFDTLRSLTWLTLGDNECVKQFEFHLTDECHICSVLRQFPTKSTITKVQCSTNSWGQEKL